jgi:hypothetical protein
MGQERTRHLKRWESLKSTRSSWIGHYQELSQFFQPRLGRFFNAEPNQGAKKHGSIIDSTGTRANRVLAAGLMAGMTSPARPWFRLTTADPDLAKFHSAKQWLNDVRSIMLDVYARSNTYRAFQSVYEELGLFGTAASVLLPDFKSVQHHYSVTAGEYALAANDKGQVDTFYRETKMRTEDMVNRFGYANCSATVRNAYDRGDYDILRDVVHAVEPRHSRDPSAPDARNMPFKSCYFETGSGEHEYLLEGGLKRFRVIAPRWNVSGGDDYGHSPGMEALGDVKQLQLEQKRKGQAIDFQTRPPLQVPTSLKDQKVAMVPGGITFVDAVNPQAGVRSLFEANLNLSYLLDDIRDVRDRVNSAFYVDLFLMLAQSPSDGRMTATEVAERHEEKLLMLGPVLERLHNEMLDQVVSLTFEDLLEAGALPPLPEELNGQPIRVEFVSMLAQAQRAVGTAATDRFVSNIGAVASLGKPDVLDKFDADKWADRYADQLGVDPDLIVSDRNVALIRQERAAKQQAAEQAAMAQQAAETANKLGATPMQGGETNALDNVMNLFSGYGTPGAETY